MRKIYVFDAAWPLKLNRLYTYIASALAFSVFWVERHSRCSAKLVISGFPRVCRDGNNCAGSSVLLAPETNAPEQILYINWNYVIWWSGNTSIWKRRSIVNPLDCVSWKSLPSSCCNQSSTRSDMMPQIKHRKYDSVLPDQGFRTR
jgi:hypothetical protein